MPNSERIDVVYVYKQSGNGDELKHSLRSLRNLTDFNGKVFVVGDSHKWFSDEIIHIPCPSKTRNFYLDAEEKWLKALSDERISDNFIAMNDDMYITESTSLPVMHQGYIKDNLSRISTHTKALMHTGEYLKSKGIDEPLSYAGHVPMLMNKAKRLEVSSIVKPTLNTEKPLLARTVYGNLFNIGGEYYEDRKSRNSYLMEGTFISTQYFVPSLSKMFPKKSRYEVGSDTKPKYSVSVLMPLYNEENLVTKALNSIPHNVAEIIAVDDGSTDNTRKIVREWAKTDDRIRLYYNRKNKGVGYTINRCYDLATSDYTVILSGDDYFHPEMEDIIDIIDGSDMVFFNLSYNIKSKIRRPNLRNYKTWAGSCKLVRREFMEGVRASNKVVNEDLELYTKLLKKPHTVQFTDIMGKHYNTPREGSLTDRKQKGEFGKQYVTIGSNALWRRYNKEKEGEV
jgi:hypothetical protein